MEQKPQKSYTSNLICCGLALLVIITMFFGWMTTAGEFRARWGEAKEEIDEAIEDLEDEMDRYDIRSSTVRSFANSVKAVRDGSLSPSDIFSIGGSFRSLYNEAVRYGMIYRADEYSVFLVFATLFRILFILSLLASVCTIVIHALGKPSVAPAIVSTVLQSFLALIFIIATIGVNASVASDYYSRYYGPVVALTIWPFISLGLAIASIVLSAKSLKTRGLPFGSGAAQPVIDSPYVAPAAPINETAPAFSAPVTPATPAAGVRFCINCGARIQPGNAFCIQCGTKVE